MTMPMPQVNEHHQKLHVFAGTWRGDEQLSPSPWGPGGHAVGHISLRVDVDGFYVTGDYHEDKDGRTVFRAHQLFGWDGHNNEYVWYWFDSMGFPPPSPSRGRWEGDTLLFHSE